MHENAFPSYKDIPRLVCQDPDGLVFKPHDGKICYRWRCPKKKEHRVQRHGETNKRRDHLQLASDSVAPRPFRSTAPPREKEGRKEREQRTRDDRERERDRPKRFKLMRRLGAFQRYFSTISELNTHQFLGTSQIRVVLSTRSGRRKTQNAR